MKHNFTFDIQEKDLDKFKELFATDGVETVYGEKINGGLFPIANIERHPDCPKDIYEAWKRELFH